MIPLGKIDNKALKIDLYIFGIMEELDGRKDMFNDWR